MTVRNPITARALGAAALLGALAIVAGDHPAHAQQPGAQTNPGDVGKPAAPDHGAGASGKGDGSGMGQDTTEIGTPKGPGDKGGPAPDKTVAPKICDDGRQPIDGACPG